LVKLRPVSKGKQRLQADNGNPFSIGGELIDVPRRVIFASPNIL
jgi:hypothetical protein